MMAKVVNTANLDDLCADAARLLHMTAAAQDILNELPFVDAHGKRLRAMDQLWAILSSLEIQAQLHLDTVEDAIVTTKRQNAA